MLDDAASAQVKKVHINRLESGECRMSSPDVTGALAPVAIVLPGDVPPPLPRSTLLRS